MALQVVHNLCGRVDGKYNVCIRGNDPEEVNSPLAKQMAIEKAAASGYHKAGINNNSGALPVDTQGVEYDTDEKLRRLTEGMRNGSITIAGYHSYHILM